MIDVLIDAIVDNVPWDDVGEWALGVGIAALAAAGIDIGLSKITGKGLLGHIRSAVSGIDDKLHKWIQEKRDCNVIIQKIVFVIELCETPVQVLDKGMRCIEVAIFGESEDGQRHATGEHPVFAVKQSEVRGLKGKREIAAELGELDLSVGNCGIENLKSKREIEVELSELGV